MSTRREDDSRPKGNVTSQRTTARDVPIAKYKEIPVGTSPPSALRGPSLLPGQGAPERIIPEEVELAVLRSAETLDGPNVARAAGRRRPEPPGSPTPTPVSVEVPRVRSVPHGLDELNSTPPSPSGRSIQSGTLMSVGSVDPRAPTELSLPSPRPLSVSERAVYFGPGAVMDRTSSVGLSSPPERQSQPAIESNRLPEVAPRTSSPAVDQSPNSSPRSVPVGSGSPSLRASQSDFAPPPAQNFVRPPRPYSPVSAAASRSPLPPSVAEASRVARPGPRSSPDIAPQFQIHSELDAVPRELLEDTFDLRSARTQREPLASRKPQSSSDWGPSHAPVSDRAAGEPTSLVSSRHSTSAMTLLVDRGGESTRRGAAPAPPKHAVVPVSWLLAAAVGVLVALLLVWVFCAPSQQDNARVPDDRASASAPSAAPVLLQPGAREAAPPVHTARPQANVVSAPALPRPASAAPKSPPAPHAVDPSLSAPPAADASAKARQSIY